MHRAFFRFLPVAALLGCNEPVPEETIIARLGEKYFTFDELKSSLPDDLSAEDSTELATNLIQSWMTRELMFEKANYNLGDEQKEIEKRVEKYRKELFIFAYEKELVRQKLDTVISEEEELRFYDENQDIFQLNDYIMKVRYVKLLPNSPTIEQVEKWMQNGSQEDFAMLNDYCHTYAVKCHVDSNWVYFNELLRELPIEVYNKEAFLRSGKFIRFNDAEYLYLLYVADLQSKNTLSPIELERSRIHALILNKRKIELLNTIRRSLYRDAFNAGRAQVYEKPQLPN